MARWRPPSPKSSPYITADGYQRLENEVKDLWQRRQETVKAITAAAAEGDRSENAEYIYRKKELRGIDSRIRYLQTRMPNLTIVREIGDETKIFFGASVTLENEQGEHITYRIVGADEMDMETQYISVDSIMGRTLLGKAIDDEILIKVDGNEKTYFIISINYN